MTPAAPPRLAGTPATLVIDGRVHAGRALLVPRGELVHGCADILAEALAALPADVDRVDLDMGDVRFMDTAGLRFLDQLGGYSHRQAVPATATNWHGQPLRILELAGLDTTDPLQATAHRPEPEPEPEPGPESAPSTAPTGPAERLHVLQEEVDQLRQAIASRPVIDQARGRAHGAARLHVGRGVAHPARGLPAVQHQAAHRRRGGHRQRRERRPAPAGRGAHGPADGTGPARTLSGAAGHGWVPGPGPRPAGGGTTMSEQTPSQAEGERDDERNDATEPPHTTPSQAEGERDDEEADTVDGAERR